MLFGILGAFTLASWRILERSWDDPEGSSDSRVILSCFRMALEPTFLTLVARESSLKLDRFSGLPGGTPEFRIRTSGRVSRKQ